MPYQVNGQSVVTRPQKVLHGAGGGGEAGAAESGRAFVGMMLSAHASAMQAAPAIPKNIATQTRELRITSPSFEDDRPAGCATPFFLDDGRRPLVCRSRELQRTAKLLPVTCSLVCRNTVTHQRRHSGQS